MSEKRKGNSIEKWDAVNGGQDISEPKTMSDPAKDTAGRTQGERFIDLRNQTGMNRKDFAEYLGVPYRTMQEWELNRRNMPEYVFNLIEFKVQTQFGVTPEETKFKDPNALGNQMRGIEDMVEQNDNSFDGIINNLPEDKSYEKSAEARDSVLKKLKDCVKILEDEKESHPKSRICEMER